MVVSLSSTFGQLGTVDSSLTPSGTGDSLHLSGASGTKLQLKGARWSSPDLGRFLSEDPLGFAGGDANLYRFAGNDPVNFADPSGLSQAGHPLTGYSTLAGPQIGGPSLTSSLGTGLNLSLLPTSRVNFGSVTTSYANYDWNFQFNAGAGTSAIPSLGQVSNPFYGSSYAGLVGGSTYAGPSYTGMSSAGLNSLFQMTPSEMARASAFAELTGAATASNILDVSSPISPQGAALRQYWYEQQFAAIDARNYAVAQQNAADVFYAEIGRQALVRAGGALQIGQAAFEYGLAATLAAAPDATLITKAAGWGVAVHATDVLQAGFNSLFFGTPSGTFGSAATRSAANGSGFSQQAEGLAFLYDVGPGVFAPSLAPKPPSMYVSAPSTVPLKRGPKVDPNAPHNATIRVHGDLLEAGGNTIVAGGGRLPERLIRTPGGIKTGRRPDILFETVTGQLRGRNIGHVDAAGNPITRELEALRDLNRVLPTDFVPF